MVLSVVEGLVGGAEHVFNGEAIARILGDADADGKERSFDIFSETLGNALGNPAGIFGGSPGQNESELIAAVTSGCIDGAATQVKDLRHAAEGEAAHDMAVHIVDLF
jgi:hypothetical protein